MFNGLEDSDDCPDAGEALVKLWPDSLEVVTLMRFEKGTRVDAGSALAVGVLARLLALHPELTKVRIELSEPNVELAKKRADAVLQLLIDAGLPPERLEARGVQGRPGRLEARILAREQRPKR